MLIGVTATPSELPVVARTGFDYVELSGKAVAAMPEDAFLALREALGQAGLPCLGFNACFPAEVTIAGPGFDPEKARRYAEILAGRALALGVRMVGVGSPFSRRIPDGYPEGRAMREAADFLRILRDVMAPAGVTVCVEALADCYCNFINTLPEAAVLAMLADCKVVLDYYNMELMGEANRDLRPYLPLIAHVHISDDDGSPQLRSPLKPEKAAIHRRRIRWLKEAGYDQIITLETDIPFSEVRAAESLRLLRDA
ncbi:MAG: sugar phosphate isomerase/epimerase [Eubacteriales bacterium]|nr:sugar phosphate isomerase/epimerase [Eubacteriales bacterium]